MRKNKRSRCRAEDPPRRDALTSPHISWSIDRDLEVLSLTPCFSWVKTASKEVGTVSTVSTDCCKPLKRFSRRCHRLTQLKQGVNENRTVFVRRLRDMRASPLSIRPVLRSRFPVAELRRVNSTAEGGWMRGAALRCGRAAPKGTYRQLKAPKGTKNKDVSLHCNSPTCSRAAKNWTGAQPSQGLNRGIRTATAVTAEYAKYAERR